MIIPSTEKILKNTKNNFYYCGVEISKNNFDITEFAEICNKINDLKHQLYEERSLEIVRSNYKIINKTHLYSNYYVFISVYKDKCFLGLYNDKLKCIEQLTKDTLSLFTDNNYLIISRQMGIISNQIIKGIESNKNTVICRIKNHNELITFTNYQQNIEKLSNCFYRTEELEFINGYDQYILTDYELKEALS